MLGNRWSGQETLSLLQTMGDLETWGSSAPLCQFFLPAHPATIQAAQQRGDQEHPVLRAVFNDTLRKAKPRAGDRAWSRAKHLFVLGSALKVQSLPTRTKKYTSMFKIETNPEISRMRCLVPVHQLIFVKALSSAWHWELRDRPCDK